MRGIGQEELLTRLASNRGVERVEDGVSERYKLLTCNIANDIFKWVFIDLTFGPRTLAL